MTVLAWLPLAIAPGCRGTPEVPAPEVAVLAGGAQAPLEAVAPPTAALATYREMWLDAQTARHPSDGGGALVEVEVPDAVPVGAPVTVAVTLEVGPRGIAVGGTVTLTASPFWGWTPPRPAPVGAPGPPGSTRVEGPDDVQLDAQAIGGMLVVTVRDRPLLAGERVRFVYGEGGTARADRFAERAPALWLAVDGDGDGVRAVVGGVEVNVVAGPPAQVITTLPSVAAPGDRVTLRLAAVDRVGNGFGAPGDQAELVLRGTAGLVLPERVRLDDQGLAAVEVRVAQAGIHLVEARGSRVAGRSNPMVVRAGAEPILWADLQIHSAWSDGSGHPEDLYRYARQVAGLDVAAVTDHDHWGMRMLDGAPDLVAGIVAATEAADAPGAFVAIHGFEWTSWVWGHRHVLWFDRPRDPLSSLDPRYDTPAELHEALRGQPAVVIRHHPAGGPVAVDWSTPLDPELEPVVEVASVHGQSESPSLPGAIYDAVPEAFVERQLAGGARMGLIGSTDGHDGHPGLSQLNGGQGGLAALVGAVATRDSVLETLRARRVYATNGPRIVLRFDVGGAPMGAAIPAGGRVTATVRVVGTAPIERIELVRRDGVVGSRRGEGSEVLFAEIPVDPRPGDLVYVRVVQADGGLAWSSPVYFD